MKKSLSKNASLLIIIFLLNGALGYGYYFLHGRISLMNKQVTEKAAEIEEQKEKTFSDKALRDILISTEEDRSKIDSYLLQDDDVVDFLEKIEELGEISKTRVVTSSVNIDERGEKSTTGFLQLNINAFGPFENIMHFISLIESLPYKVAIDKLILSTVGDNGQQPVKGSQTKEWQSNFELKVVKLKDK